MATITRVLDRLDQNGWSAQELGEMDNREVVRNFFRADTVYGGANDNVGKFDARKVGIIIKSKKDDGTTEEKRRLIWAVCYIVTTTKGEEKVERVQDALTKSFLLSQGRYDVDNNHIKPQGDVREWADLNIVNGVLECEWCKSLAELLNQRGLVLVREEYKQPKREGGWFMAHIDHPHFADTFKAE
jgi:hypothetical protein